MKKYILISLSLFSFFLISCDDADDIPANTDCLVKSISYDEDGGTWLVEFFYNDDQTRLDSVYQYANGDINRIIRIEYAGNITKLKWYDEPAFEFAFQEQLTFDSNDLLIKRTQTTNTVVVETQDSLVYQGNELQSIFTLNGGRVISEDEYVYTLENATTVNISGSLPDYSISYDYYHDINKISNDFIVNFVIQDSDWLQAPLFSADPLKLEYRAPSAASPGGYTDTLTYTVNAQNYPKVITHSDEDCPPATITYMNCQ